nr:CAZy families GH2 protein [uncultured Clostridium sp.]
MRHNEELLVTTTVVTNQETSITLPKRYAWSPETPELYDVTVNMGEDCVSSYFSLRKISVVRDVQGTLRFALNGRPYFMNGVLDQGYWPDTLLTPPNEEALKRDILTMKQVGFNTLRKHVKVETESFYAMCDLYGMLVWSGHA